MLFPRSLGHQEPIIMGNDWEAQRVLPVSHTGRESVDSRDSQGKIQGFSTQELPRSKQLPWRASCSYTRCCMHSRRGTSEGHVFLPGVQLHALCTGRLIYQATASMATCASTAGIKKSHISSSSYRERPTPCLGWTPSLLLALCVAALSLCVRGSAMRGSLPHRAGPRSD